MAKLSSQDASITSNTNAINAHVGNISNPHSTKHNQLSDITAADSHPTSAITGLDAKQTEQDNAITANTTLINNHKATNNQDHQITHDMLVGQNPEPDPHPQYEQKKPSMALAGTVDSFTLNTTDSKLVNYSLSGEANTSGNIDAVAGEITIPSNGIYTIRPLALGLQGNDTKEEDIHLLLDVAVVDAERYIIDVFTVATDKTSSRALGRAFSRFFQAGQVLSLWMYATADLGTFTVATTTFEVFKTAYE